MTDNIKIRTEDVSEILDPKIITTSAHSQLDVALGDTYADVLSKIAARSPNLNEKLALDNATLPSALNPYITLSELNTELAGKVAWKTVGLIGSGADYEGSNQQPFNDAIAAGASWIMVHPGTYTFSSSVALPTNIRMSGTSPNATKFVGACNPVLEIGAGASVSFLSVEQQASGAAVNLTGNGATVWNCVLTSPITSRALSGSSGLSDIKVWESAILVGKVAFTSLQDSYFHGLYFDSPTTQVLSLLAPVRTSVTACVFKSGQFAITSGTSCRIVANHFHDGSVNTTPISDVLFRANTPNTNNNEADDFTNLLQYIGSPSITTVDPAYSSNFGGIPGDDLTTRTGMLDLLIQWRYEERNWHLTANAETLTVTWNPVARTLTTSGQMNLISSHRIGKWTLPSITNLTIGDGYAAYYVIDRSLDSSDISLLQPTVAILGSIPLSNTSRQVFVLAVCIGKTLWWRGGGGSRFPGTGDQTGVYFVDGSSKSLLDYLGASDYNDYDPNYSDNFGGNQTENLVTRIGKHDTLIRRLFEYSNLGVTLGDTTSISWDGATLTINATALGDIANAIWFSMPHVPWRIYTPTNSWAIADGEVLYFSWNQASPAADHAISSNAVVANGSVLMPNSYPLTTKYFAFARRVGSNVYLWNDFELPPGGRYPVQFGRSVVRSAAPVVLDDNVKWTGSDLLWEGLSLAVSTGLPLTRNTFPNKTTPDAAGPSNITSLASEQGLLVTHTWNAGSASDVTIQKIDLPYSGVIDQNQFVWVQNRNGSIFFIE